MSKELEEIIKQHQQKIIDNEFKIRCYDRAGKLGMRYFDDLYEMENYHGLYKYCASMRCTYLKDIDGDLIYEGDILLVPENLPKTVANYIDLKNYLFLVEYNYVRLCELQLYLAPYCRIIGNIFESPEKFISGV